MAGIPFWLQNVIGNSARAGLIAAGSPTPGAVGTIRDAVGGLQAAEADQQQRMDRAMMMRRAALQEQRAMEQMEMEREQNDAMLEYRKAQRASEEAQRDRANRPAKNAAQEIRERIAAYEQEFGRPLTEREKQTVVGTHGPQYDQRGGTASSEPKTPQQVAAQRLAKIDNYQKEPWLDPTGEGEKEDWAFIERVNRSNDPAPKPPPPQRPPSTAEAAIVGPLYQRLENLEKLGTPQAMAEAEKVRKELRSIMQSKKAERAPSTQIIWGDSEDEDGVQEAIVVPKGKLGGTGITRKPKAASGSSAVIDAFLGGGSATTKATSQPPKEALSSLKEGVVTTFGNGQKWTLKGGKPTQVN